MTEHGKHTPGPWKIVGGVTILADDGEPIANILMPRPLDSERIANVHLIAASPELFSATKLALKRLIRDTERSHNAAYERILRSAITYATEV